MGAKPAKSEALVIKNILRGMKESSQLKEDTVLTEQKLAENDPHIKTLLEACYLDAQREKSFERFLHSKEFQVILEELRRHCLPNKNLSICEIGAGSGFLAAALARSGYQNVDLLEPNGHWNSGTGFIRSFIPEISGHIWNDLDAWYDSPKLYDIVITNNCVHHFDNVCKVAAEISCKMNPEAKWLMFDEQLANSSRELNELLTTHPHARKYGQFEWAYSGSLYVDLIRLAGFKLIYALPNRYCNNSIFGNLNTTIRFSGIVTAITKLLIALHVTVLAYEIERFLHYYLKMKLNLFMKPQLLVFQRNGDYS